MLGVSAEMVGGPPLAGVVRGAGSVGDPESQAPVNSAEHGKDAGVTSAHEPTWPTV